jgi:hypothetical protein
MEVRMNEIRVKRLLIAGVVMFLVWIVAEIIVEQVFVRVLLGDFVVTRMTQPPATAGWGARNHVLNILLALLNTTIFVWLYASLRPMFGVGTKTALITCGFGVVLLFSMTINAINLGLIPADAGLLEVACEAVEFPLAMIAAAAVYEGQGQGSRTMA